MKEAQTEKHDGLRAEYPLLFEEVQDLIRRYSGSIVQAVLDAIDDEEWNDGD